VLRETESLIDGQGIVVCATLFVRPSPPRICQETAIALGQLHLQDQEMSWITTMAVHDGLHNTYVQDGTCLIPSSTLVTAVCIQEPLSTSDLCQSIEGPSAARIYEGVNEAFPENCDADRPRVSYLQ
jgi:hypothetical protein